MNILHLKYAVEIAKAGSINKASEALRMGQPNLSRAIKELEVSLGITIFDRSARGMVVTPEGEEFLGYARNILKQIDEVKSLYKPGHRKTQKFSISVPHAGYISSAFARFSRCLCEDPAELFFKETDAQQVIKDLMQGECRLAVIRYNSDEDRFYKELLDEKGIAYELVAEFRNKLIVNKNSPLVNIGSIKYGDLSEYIEIDCGEGGIGANVSQKRDESPSCNRKINVPGRTAQLELLSSNPDAFMLDCPLPQHELARYGLVQKECADEKKIFKDLLIYRREYTFSALDKSFITELCISKREVF